MCLKFVFMMIDKSVLAKVSKIFYKSWYFMDIWKEKAHYLVHVLGTYRNEVKSFYKRPKRNAVRMP